MKQAIEEVSEATKTRPIIFSGPMVLAILGGKKTQTRRAFRPQPSMPHFRKLSHHDGTPGAFFTETADFAGMAERFYSPFGKPGDRLWVRETWQRADGFTVTESCVGNNPKGEGIVYRADQVAPWGFTGTPWKPSIFMPRCASRLTLEITEVRVERLQSISAEDCWAEGCDLSDEQLANELHTPLSWYSDLWDSINGDGAWAKNPFVWCISFWRLP